MVFRELKKSKVFTLITGTGLSQAIPLLFSLVLTRIYDPIYFGTFVLFFATCSIGAVVVTGRYELAIMLPKKNIVAANLLSLSMVIAFLISLLLLIALLAFSDFILIFANQVITYETLMLIPLGIFLTAVFQCTNYWFNRNNKFLTISKYRITQSLITALLSIAFGLWGFKEVGLIYGYLIGLVVPILCFFFFSKRKFKVLQFNLMWGLSREYVKFPKIVMPTALLDVAALQAPLFFISKYFNPAIVGSYSLAFRTVSAPISVISASFGQIFFNQASEILKGNNSCILPTLFATLKRLTIFSLFIFLPIIAFGDILFEIAFGKEWFQSGQYVKILAIGMMIKFIVSPVTSLLIAAKKVEWAGAWQIFYFSTTILIFTLFRSLSVEELLWIYVSHEIILYSIYLTLVYIIAKRNDNNILCAE